MTIDVTSFGLLSHLARQGKLRRVSLIKRIKVVNHIIIYSTIENRDSKGFKPI